MVKIKLLTTAHALEACAGLQQRVWGLEDEIMGASHMVAAVHAGGMAAGAYEDDVLVGFVFGFLAYRGREAQAVGLHSHLLAVLPEQRGQGIGRALKWFQRDWCLERGLTWMTWTFDPLQAQNARLNLEHLGAVVREYRSNEYGILGGTLNAGLPTDRLLAYWQLDGQGVRQLAVGTSLAEVSNSADAPYLLRVTDVGWPQVLSPELTDTELVRAEITPDFNTLLKTNPGLALEWRLAVRQTLEPLLAKAWTITRFIDNAYLIEYEVETARNDINISSPKFL